MLVSPPAKPGGERAGAFKFGEFICSGRLAWKVAYVDAICSRLCRLASFFHSPPDCTSAVGRPGVGINF